MKKKSRKAHQKAKNVFKSKNKLFDEMYISDHSDEEHRVDIPEDLNFDDTEQKLNSKFDKKVLPKPKSHQPIFIQSAWKSHSKNQLAEKGFTIPLTSTKTPNLPNNSLQPQNSPNSDEEIEFIDPERLKREKLEKEKAEKGDQAQVKVIMAASSSSRRKQFFDGLRKKRIGKMGYEDFIKLNKVTDLKTTKEQPKEENEVIKEEEKNNEKDEEELIEDEVEKYLEENEEKIDVKKIRELEGDYEEENDDFADEEESEGDQEDNQEAEGDNEEDDESDFGQPENLEEETEEQKKQRYIEKLNKIKKQIAKRRHASKFMEMEAELGSDNENNDGLKNIDKNDIEEILDKRLEFEDADIENLIDNQHIEESVENLASKFLQDGIDTDNMDIVNIIKAITQTSRKRRGLPQSLEEDSSNFLQARMAQKLAQLKSNNQDISGVKSLDEGDDSELKKSRSKIFDKLSSDIKKMFVEGEETIKKILELCEQQGLDEEDRIKVIEVQIFRKMKADKRQRDERLRQPLTSHSKDPLDGIEVVKRSRNKRKDDIYRPGFLIHHKSKNSILSSNILKKGN
jgi:hypothetical protein